MSDVLLDVVLARRADAVGEGHAEAVGEVFLKPMPAQRIVADGMAICANRQEA